MDQIFKINRFGNLLLRSLVQYKQTYIRISLFFLATFILLGSTDVIGIGAMGLYKIIVNTLIVVSPVFVFFKRRTHTSHIFEFTLPASLTEKFLVKLLSCIFIFPAFIITISFLFIGAVKVIPFDPISNVAEHLYTLLVEGTISQYWSLIAIQSIFLCGSYFFKDSVFIKVVLIIMGISVIALIMILIGVFSALDFSYGFVHFEFDNLYLTDFFESEKTYIRNILNIIRYFIPVGLWFASFFKLKETEI